MAPVVTSSPAQVTFSGEGVKGLTFPRRFTTPGVHPYDQLDWEYRDAIIGNEKGKSVFEQKNVEFPKSWSQLATNVVASKYFRGHIGTPEREWSLRQLIDRVVNTITAWADTQHYFASDEDLENFTAELQHLLVNQKMAFNSPVWFNVGIHEQPQCSACFINSVRDDMGSIMDLAKTEAMLFKGGSGAGVNLSTLRGAGEKLRVGGTASGPVSFMKGLDAFAGVVKSGGTCLAPWQSIYTEKGPVPVQSLAERNERFVVLSYDPPAGRYKAKWASAWLTGTKELVRVTTDKGQFDLTFDHPVKLSDGSYRYAGDLQEGNSLFAASVNNHNGYAKVHLRNGEKGVERFHRMVAQDLLGIDLNNGVIHHVDFDQTNNHPDNLQLLATQAEHASLHMKQQVSEGTHVFQTHSFPRPGEMNPMHRSAEFWMDPTRVDSYKSKQSLAMHSGRASRMQPSAARQKMLNTGFKLLNAGYDVSTPETYLSSRRKHIGKMANEKKVIEGIVARFGSYDGYLNELSSLNHRVVSVTPLGLSPVYDVEVECPTADDKSENSGHNFVIWPNGEAFGSGIAVSNTRRAAKMVILNVDHPDVIEFIDSKKMEEQKAWALIEQGYDASFTGEAYGSVFFQNANHSVRVTDQFMTAYERDDNWTTYNVTDHSSNETYKAKDIFRKMAEAAHLCGDPGIQYDSTINEWHTCSNTDRIHASNPCCFIGSTLVDTSEGSIRIDQIAAMSERGEPLPFAFSYDLDDQLPVLRRITKAWVAGETTTLVEVKTDKGLTLRCTPEHLFLTHSGEYIEARSLVPGTRLRKISRAQNDTHESRRYIYHRTTETAPNGGQIMARWMWENAYGPIPEGFEVDHINGDPTDDRLSNFRLLERGEHRSISSSADKNPRYIDVSTETLVHVWEAIESTSRRTHTTSKATVTPARWNAYVRSQNLAGQVPIAASSKIRGLAWTDFEAWVRDQQSAANDRIVSVTPITLDEPVKVYDIEVPGTSNFGVRNDTNAIHSVVVHNSEYMFLNDTACNLASLNLMKFVDPDGEFDAAAFVDATRITITAQEILVDNAGYPTPQIEQNSHLFRPLGIGYANLGALLMSRGLAYDSNEGRAYAAAITAMLTGESFRQSAEIARDHGGPFAKYEENAEPFLRVMRKHQSAVDSIPVQGFLPAYMMDTARKVWDDAVELGERYGYRNAQASVLAPTGTIAFMMDCDTTGIEPDIALIKYKKLVGEGYLKLVNQTVPAALRKLGYSDQQADSIIEYIAQHETIEGAPALKDEHLPIFDCAFKPQNGTRSIEPMGHVRMMAATQPFLSGAISKTVNMPSEATVEDIEKVYYDGWKLGLKAIAIYRDGSKRSQPLSTGKNTIDSVEVTGLQTELAGLRSQVEALQNGSRRKLPNDRVALTHKFQVSGHEGYLTVGLYEDGRPGEIFLRMSKEGSTLSGLLDSFATSISIGLQWGVPLTSFVSKFSHTRFEPQGFTGNPEIPIAKSIIDYIFRWLGARFLGEEASKALGNQTPDMQLNGFATPEVKQTPAVMAPVKNGTNGNGHAKVELKDTSPVKFTFDNTADAPACVNDGSIMYRAGSCYVCPACGNSSGCS